MRIQASREQTPDKGQAGDWRQQFIRAPYYTVIAPGRRGDQVKQWDEIKLAVMETLIDLGGTITHHHAVGRDHRPGYDHQRPELFAEVLRSAKQTLDPDGLLSPGVLI